MEAGEGHLGRAPSSPTASTNTVSALITGFTNFVQDLIVLGGDGTDGVAQPGTSITRPTRCRRSAPRPRYGATGATA